MNSFETFKALHYGENPLVIGNAWDVTSASVYEQCGLQAIATSSRAIANSMGYADGENIPFDLLLQTVKQIASQIHLPLSVDIEGGFSRKIPEIIEHIERLYDLGAVGFNIEDSLPVEGGILQSPENFQLIIAAVADHLARKNMSMYMNVRTDAFLLKVAAPLTETIKRIKRYEEAGASGIFVPFVANEQDIREIAAASSMPLNVLAIAHLPPIPVLKDWGVKRISLGSSMFLFAARTIEMAVHKIQEEQSFAVLF